MQRRDLNFAVEALLQVADGFLAHHGLEMLGDYRGCDERAYDNRRERGGNSNDPTFFTGCHPLGETVRLGECFRVSII